MGTSFSSPNHGPANNYNDDYDDRWLHDDHRSAATHFNDVNHSARAGNNDSQTATRIEAKQS